MSTIQLTTVSTRVKDRFLFYLTFIRIINNSIVHFCVYKHWSPNARGYSRFHSTGMIEWGQNSKPKKIPWASNKTQKNPRLNFRALKVFRKH